MHSKVYEGKSGLLGEWLPRAAAWGHCPAARTVAAAMVASALLFAPGSSPAAPVTVVNHSFEDPAVMPGEFDTSAPPAGWSGYGTLDFGYRTIGVLNPDSTTLYTEPVPDGSNVGVAFLGETPMNSEAGLEQTLAATLQANTSYTLTVEVGNIANDGNFPHNQFEFAGFPGYRIELLAGAQVIASDDNSLLPAEGAFLTSVIEVEIGDDHANEGEPLAIRLINLDEAPGLEVNFDNVRLDAEPLDPEVSACPETAPLDCKAAAPRKSQLKLGRRDGVPAKSAMGWSWSGEATDLLEFGAPDASSDYRLCVYDGVGDVVAELTAAAGGTCAGKDCWKGGAKGFRYKDASASPDGLISLVLKAGDEGKAKIKLKAKGANLIVPTLPLTIAPDPVRVVLVNEESGLCWSASFATASTKPDATTKWTGKSD